MMDPTAALTELMELAHDTLAGTNQNRHARDLAERICALDVWLGGGGFLPSQWNTASREFARKDVPTEPTFLILGLCLDSKTVDYLKDLCRSLRLPVSGRKAEIVYRIVDHYRKEAAR